MEIINKLQNLLQKGTLGFYNTVEVTEIFAISPSNKILNVFTIIVAEERIENTPTTLLNNKRITVKGLKKWSFGIKRYTKKISEILLDIETLNKKNIWNASGENLNISNKLEYSSYRFIPPDSTLKVQLNNILKNNFDNGSYLFEWFDFSKKELNDLLISPHFILDLSSEIQRYIPLQLSTVSEQIGNIVFQIPIKVLVLKLQERQDDNLVVNICWHKKAIKRKLLLNIKKSYDDTIFFYHSQNINENDTQVIIKNPNNERKKGYEYIVWDIDNKLIIGAINYLSFFNQIAFKFNISSKERIFYSKNKEIKIGINSIQNSLIDPYNLNTQNEKISWIEKRTYKQEKNSLIKQKKFVQYNRTTD